MATPAIAQPQPHPVKQGEYLARAGDCFSCHTKEGGALMAGGRQIQTPYGTIGSPNITPDKDTGIGSWSDDDLDRVLHVPGKPFLAGDFATAERVFLLAAA